MMTVLSSKGLHQYGTPRARSPKEGKMLGGSDTTKRALLRKAWHERCSRGSFDFAKHPSQFPYPRAPRQVAHREQPRPAISALAYVPAMAAS
jgi:hypothetical protein